MRFSTPLVNRLQARAQLRAVWIRLFADADALGCQTLSWSGFIALSEKKEREAPL